MAGLASYYNPETNTNPYCESCGTRHWSTLTNCADCEAELCSECGVEQGDDERSVEIWLCRTCARKRATTRAEEAVALEAEQRDSDPSNLWDDSRETWLETSEFRQSAPTCRAHADKPSIRSRGGVTCLSITIPIAANASAFNPTSPRK